MVRQLLPRISRAAIAAPAKHFTDNAAAHDLYLQGRFFFEKRDGASLRKAQSYFEQAIAIDSSYALAWSGLADAYSHASVFGFARPIDNFPKAKEYATKAIALDSTFAEAHASRAFVALFYEWDWAIAGREFDRALALDPRSSSAHLWHAWYFIALGKVNEAIGEARTSVALDRFSAVNNARLVTALFLGHRYDEALAQALKAVEMNPDFIGAKAELGRVYIYLGRCAEALADDALGQQSAMLLGARALGYAKCGHRAQAVAELDRLTALDAQGTYESHYGFAMIQAGLGNTDQALTELEKAYLERAWPMFMIRFDPAFDSLRADPRFVELVRRMRFVS